jgi:hypothetical protein
VASGESGSALLGDGTHEITPGIWIPGYAAIWCNVVGSKGALRCRGSRAHQCGGMMSSDVLSESYERFRHTGPEWGADVLTNHGRWPPRCWSAGGSSPELGDRLTMPTAW